MAPARGGRGKNNEDPRKSLGGRARRFQENTKVILFLQSLSDDAVLRKRKVKPKRRNTFVCGKGGKGASTTRMQENRKLFSFPRVKVGNQETEHQTTWGEGKAMAGANQEKKKKDARKESSEAIRTQRSNGKGGWGTSPLEKRGIRLAHWNKKDREIDLGRRNGGAPLVRKNRLPEGDKLVQSSKKELTSDFRRAEKTCRV